MCHRTRKFPCVTKLRDDISGNVILFLISGGKLGFEL
jgi:hypothetical protein